MPDIRKIIIHQVSMDTEVVEGISRAVEELYLPNLGGGVESRRRGHADKDTAGT